MIENAMNYINAMIQQKELEELDVHYRQYDGVHGILFVFLNKDFKGFQYSSEMIVEFFFEDESALVGQVDKLFSLALEAYEEAGYCFAVSQTDHLRKINWVM